MADTQREELARLARLVRNGIYSPNETRERLGLPALPTEVDLSLIRAIDAMNRQAH